MLSEAAELIEAEVALLARRPYAALAALIDTEPGRIEVRGASGKVYQVTLEVFWDKNSGETIRVVGAIDDSGWRAFAPLCRDELVLPPEEPRRTS